MAHPGESSLYMQIVVTLPSLPHSPLATSDPSTAHLCLCQLTGAVAEEGRSSTPLPLLLLLLCQLLSLSGSPRLRSSSMLPTSHSP